MIFHRNCLEINSILHEKHRIHETLPCSKWDKLSFMMAQIKILPNKKGFLFLFEQGIKYKCQEENII
jgi:hypothetical protein